MIFHLTRDCGIMQPNDKYEYEINLKWFILTQEKNFQEFSIGKEGLRRLKKLRVRRYPFIIPSKPVQDEIVVEFDKMIKLKKKLNEINSKINFQFEKTIHH